jgi:glycosyltransferase involved in cell wall biosynthesis
MKRAVFFINRMWAFGTIHYGLMQMLFQHGFDCEVMDWSVSYNAEEFNMIVENTDIFLTTTDGVASLLSYNVPFEKIYGVAHGQWDLLLANKILGRDFYDKLAGFGAVSNILKIKAKEFGISREPSVIPFGINTNRFYSKVSNKLEVVATAGAYESHNFFGEEIKRGRLTEQATHESVLLYKNNKRFHYLSMPCFYRSVDCVVMSSTEEGAGLPMLEAAAAGRLTIGTPVGYYEENWQLSGGICVPIESDKFVIECKKYLTYFKDNPADYVKQCKCIQEYAMDNYNWTKFIDRWINFLQ